MLHTINKAPDHPRFQSCLAALTPEDHLLLTESAVLALTDATFAPPCPYFALTADVQARGLSGAAEPERLVDTQGWVRMTAEHDQMMNW